MVLLDDLVRDPEAEAGPGDALGREKRLKDAVERRQAHSGPIIGNGDADPLASVDGVTSEGGAQGKAATGGQCIGRIADEIGEDLADLSIVSRDHGYRAELTNDLDTETTQTRLKQGEDGLDEVMDVDTGGIRGSPVEAERLDGDLGDAVEFLLGEFQVGAGLGRQGRLADEVEAVGDGLEWVVNLVGYGGGEATGDSELFRAAENLFAALLAGSGRR